MRFKIFSLVFLHCLYSTADIRKCMCIVYIVLFFILQMKPWISGIGSWTTNYCTLMFGVSIMGFSVILHICDFHALMHVM
jgi:hypothetical protein